MRKLSECESSATIERATTRKRYVPLSICTGDVIGVLSEHLGQHMVAKRQPARLRDIGRQVDSGLLSHVVGVATGKKLRARWRAELEDRVVGQPHASRRELVKMWCVDRVRLVWHSTALEADIVPSELQYRTCNGQARNMKGRVGMSK